MDLTRLDGLKTLADALHNSSKSYGNERWSYIYGGELSYTYAEFEKKCQEISDILSDHGIGQDDKVAIFSGGTPNWSVALFSAAAYGRTAVPILPEFTGSEAKHVLSHSESKALFVASKQLARLSEDTLSQIELIFDIDTLEIIRDNAAIKGAAAPVREPAADDIAVIIYTSGTTGQAKGVMLTHGNIMANVHAGIRFYPLDTHDTLLSILPLAHAYELSLGLIYPFSSGSSVCYISKPPTPSYLIKVMADVRPTAMLTVPLIIEKVYKSTVVPTIRKSKVLSWMDKHMNTILCRIIGKKMIKTFGGRMAFFGIGGAKLDVEVEKFLFKARFPYYIGYGLTECAPLLTLCTYKNTTPGAIGYPIYGVELKLIDAGTGEGQGEIVAKGPNIMPGYYKDPERTKEAFTEDGWFRTKDIAEIDSKGRYAIRGRIGNMILGPSGENIYPEEIEAVINDMPDIEDSIVIGKAGRLVALVKVADTALDLTKAEGEKIKFEIERIKKDILTHVNSKVNQSSKIASVELMKEPFIKTATLKIKRFLYKDNAPTV